MLRGKGEWEMEMQIRRNAETQFHTIRKRENATIKATNQLFPLRILKSLYFYITKSKLRVYYNQLDYEGDYKK